MVDLTIEYPFSKEAAQDLHEPIMAVVVDLIKSVQETEEGYSLSFGRVPMAIQPLAQLVQVQRVLNPFMRMALVVESNEGPIRLDLSGPTGTKEFLFSEFGLQRWMSN